MNIIEELMRYFGNKGPWKEVEEVFELEGIPKEKRRFDAPFQNLVAVILSQNTSDRNSTRAYIGLLKKFGEVSPERIRKASIDEIKDAIRPGGLYNIKAKRIKELAEVFDNIDMNKLKKMSREEARKELMKIKGIGEKTADVFLNYVLKKSSIPIDTNIKRVVRRLGWVRENASYDEIKRELEKRTPKKHWGRAHELLIRLGRDICRPRNPTCDICPLRNMCKFNKSREKNVKT